jgi:hypothetical protein
MQMMHGAMRYGQKRVIKKLIRAVPWLGAAVAVVTLGQAVKRKGVFAGTLDSALDAIPFVGGAKTLCEAVRGRDFIPERSAASGQLPVVSRSPAIRY